MSRRQYSLHIVMALIAGLIGGGISGQFLRGQPVFAAKEPKPSEVISSKVIYAQELLLIDDRGLTRAVMTVREGEPSLAFYDKDGITRLGLRLGTDGAPSLNYRDKNGKIRLGLFLLQQEGLDGEPGLIFFDEYGKARLELGSTQLKETKTGTIIKRSALVLFDKEGKVYWSTPGP